MKKKFQMTTRESILKTLKSNKLKLSEFGIRSVGLFGSYIRGEQTRESDIDLLIDFEPEKENFDNFMAVCDLFENIFKNEKIDKGIYETLIRRGSLITAKYKISKC